MSALLHKFIQIALLREGPQELPGLAMVLWIALAAVFMTSLAIIYAALRLKDRQSRFRQCYAAICGASAVVYALALPLMPIFFSANVSTLSGKLIIVFMLLLDVWMLLISAHIFRHTFEVGMATGVSLALGLMVFTLVAIESITPASSVQPGGSADLTLSLYQPLEQY